MKPSTYARQVGVAYKTAYRWWKAGQLDAYQTASGTIIVRESQSQEHPLSRYAVEWQPDDHHLARVGNPRLYEHPYHSPQLPSWEPGEVEWFIIIRTNPRLRRHRKRGRVLLIQPPLWQSNDEASS